MYLSFKLITFSESDLMSSAVGGAHVSWSVNASLRLSVVHERTTAVCSLVTVWRLGLAEEDNFF